MFQELKNCIMDSFDPAMKSYVESDEYQQANLEFNQMYENLYNDLPEDMRKRLTKLMNARGNLESGLALEAYYRGVIHGTELHNDVK